MKRKQVRAEQEKQVRAKQEELALRLPSEVSMERQKWARSLVKDCPHNGNHAAFLPRGRFKEYEDCFREFFPVKEDMWPKEKPDYFTQARFDKYTELYERRIKGAPDEESQFVILTPTICDCQALRKFHESMLPLLHWLETGESDVEDDEL